MRLFILHLILVWFCIGSTKAETQLFKYVVATDGSGTHQSLQAAIDEAPEHVRTLIFIKNGVYEEKISIGSLQQPSAKLISLIGESADGVVFTSDRKMTSENGLAWTDVVTAQIYASDFYAENITFQNNAGVGGQALALHNGADRQTFKNCKLLGFQDTHRSKKGVRCYFKDSWIEGTVDFIYAGGVIFFDDCTINCVNGGGYIAAPEDCIATIPKSKTEAGVMYRVGFFFRQCTLTANADVADNSFYLGRPWNTAAGAYYLNCKMGKQIKPEGWQTWGGNETSAMFAEYQSMDLDGNLLDVSKRVAWSRQLLKNDVDKLLNPTYIYDFVKASNGSSLYDPISICKSPWQPAMLYQDNATLSWEKVSGVAGYVLYKDGRYIGSTTQTTFSDLTSGAGEYSIRTISEMGVLGAPLKVGEKGFNALPSLSQYEKNIVVTGTLLSWKGTCEATLFDISGKQLAKSVGEEMALPQGAGAGVYLLKLADKENKVFSSKVYIGR